MDTSEHELSVSHFPDKKTYTPYQFYWKGMRSMVNVPKKVTRAMRSTKSRQHLTPFTDQQEERLNEGDWFNTHIKWKMGPYHKALGAI